VQIEAGAIFPYHCLVYAELTVFDPCIKRYGQANTLVPSDLGEDLQGFSFAFGPGKKAEAHGFIDFTLAIEWIIDTPVSAASIVATGIDANSKGGNSSGGVIVELRTSHRCTILARNSGNRWLAFDFDS
jgi:hypothetical protein